MIKCDKCGCEEVIPTVVDEDYMFGECCVTLLCKKCKEVVFQDTCWENNDDPFEVDSN